MIKIQYIELLRLRGITELKQGQSLFSAVVESGGDPTQEEMVKVNEASMRYYIDQFKLEQEKNAVLAKENERLTNLVNSLEDDSLFLSCLQGAGVDNWDGYGDAQESFDEIKAQEE